jgi:hypothetical protein
MDLGFGSGPDASVFDDMFFGTEADTNMGGGGDDMEHGERDYDYFGIDKQ